MANAFVNWVTPEGKLNSSPVVELNTYVDVTIEATLADYYEVVDGFLPWGLSMDSSTGQITGTPTELDDYWPPYRPGPDFKFDEQNYATVGSAAQFSGQRAIETNITFTVRASDTTGIYNFEFDDREFYFGITNNWSSDRDNFILKLDNQFYLEGKPVSNEEYLFGMKDNGFFPGGQRG